VGGALNCIAPTALTYVGLAFEAAGGLSDSKAVASAAVVKALLEAEARPVLPYVGKRLEGVRSLKPITSMYRRSGLVRGSAAPSCPPLPAARLHACTACPPPALRPPRTWPPARPAPRRARRQRSQPRPPPAPQIGVIAAAESSGAGKAVDQLSAKFEALAKGVSEPALAVAKAVAVSAYRSKLGSNAGAVEDFGKQLLARGKVRAPPPPARAGSRARCSCLAHAGALGTCPRAPRQAQHSMAGAGCPAPWPRAQPPPPPAGPCANALNAHPRPPRRSTTSPPSSPASARPTWPRS
jgi:hypothetical protein